MANLAKGIPGRSAHLSCATIDRLASEFRTALDLDRAAELLPAGRRDYDEALHKPHVLRAMVKDRIKKGSKDAGSIADWLRELAFKAESAVDVKQTSFSGLEAVRDIAAVVEDLVRMERCRVYVERVLHIEMLVGDLEDSVASIAMGLAERRFRTGGSGMVRDCGDIFLEALSRLESVEEALAVSSQAGPEAGQLVRAVELRLDRAAVTIRSATVAEFGLFLESMGWPPPLTLGEREFRDNSLRANPFLEASDSSLSRFKLYFRVLSVLQALQQKRASEQLKKDFLMRENKTRDPTGLNVDMFLSYKPLWAMEELVKPFASQASYHFKKWTQKPELVCALAHSMCQEFVDTVDALLQPIISDAGLTGYNAREEWIRPFVLMVQSFLTSSVFPGLVEDVDDRSAISRSATSLWLHTVDEILAFDSKMNSLLVQDTGVVRFSSGVDSIIQHGIIEKTGNGLGVVHVFVERPHWLDVWAQIECADSWEKLMTVLNTEEAWLVKESNSTVIEKQIPSGVIAVMAAMWSAIDRCRSLPEVKLRLAFVQKGVIPIAEKYHEEILWRCDHIRGFAGRATDLDVRKVALCINAAHYFENKLQEWSEDYFFLELRLEDICQKIQLEPEFDLHDKDAEISGLEGTIFDDVVSLYGRFRKDQNTNLVSSIIGKFEKCCKDYSSTIASWIAESFDSVDGGPEYYPSVERSGVLGDQSSAEKPRSVSSSLVEALVMLQQVLHALSDTLQEEDFIELCWSLMVRLDEVFVSTVLPPSRRFTSSGTQQLMIDVAEFFQVFQPYSLRPASIFKGLSSAVKEIDRSVT